MRNKNKKNAKAKSSKGEANPIPPELQARLKGEAEQETKVKNENTSSTAKTQTSELTSTEMTESELIFNVLGTSEIVNLQFAFTGKIKRKGRVAFHLECCARFVTPKNDEVYEEWYNGPPGPEEEPEYDGTQDFPPIQLELHGKQATSDPNNYISFIIIARLGLRKLTSVTPHLTEEIALLPLSIKLSTGGTIYHRALLENSNYWTNMRFS